MSSILHLLSCSAGWISDAKRLTQRLRDISMCGQSLLSQADLRRLASVQRRMEALLQPLQLCVLHAPATPAAQRTVASLLELVRKVGGIIEHADWQPAADRGHILRELDPYVQELDFACLAIALVLTAHRSSGCAREIPSEKVSPSRLLDAAVRLETKAACVTLRGMWYRCEAAAAWDLVGQGRLLVQLQPRSSALSAPFLNKSRAAKGVESPAPSPTLVVECGAETATFPLKLLTRQPVRMVVPELPSSALACGDEGFADWDALLWSDSRLLLEDEPEDGGAMVVEERQWQYAFASPDVDAVWYTLRLAVYQDVSRGDRDLRNAQVPSDEVLRALLQPRSS
jgi:hypothetical protein